MRARSVLEERVAFVPVAVKANDEAVNHENFKPAIWREDAGHVDWDGISAAIRRPG
jgi:hypothetical protein